MILRMVRLTSPLVETYTSAMWLSSFWLWSRQHNNINNIQTKKWAGQHSVHCCGSGSKLDSYSATLYIRIHTGENKLEAKGVG